MVLPGELYKHPTTQAKRAVLQSTIVLPDLELLTKYSAQHHRTTPAVEFPQTPGPSPHLETMRFTNIIACAVALVLSASAAPTGQLEGRVPTPDAEAEGVAARKVYTSWYRATNIIGVADD